MAWHSSALSAMGLASLMAGSTQLCDQSRLEDAQYGVADHAAADLFVLPTRVVGKSQTYSPNMELTPAWRGGSADGSEVAGGCSAGSFSLDVGAVPLGAATLCAAAWRAAFG